MGHAGAGCTGMIHTKCVVYIVCICADVGGGWVADGRSRIEEGRKSPRSIEGRVGVSPDDFQGVRVVLSSTP